jgi:hypothetical protein
MEINETYARIGEYIRSHESETYGQIAATLGLGRGAVARIARVQGIKRRPGKRPSALEAAVAAIEAVGPKQDGEPGGEAATPPEETVPSSTIATPPEAGQAGGVDDAGKGQERG